MEHRWGERIRVDIPVKISGHPFNVRVGRLANLSVSGAFLEADFDLRMLSRIQVTIDLPRVKHEAPFIPAYIARKYKGGIGIEWCEFAPQPISELLHMLSIRRHSPLRRPEVPSAIAVTRLSGSLLKHSTGT